MRGVARALSDPDTRLERLTLHDANERSLWIRGTAEGDSDGGEPVRALGEHPKAISAESTRFASELAGPISTDLDNRHSPAHADELLTPAEVMGILHVGDVRTARRYMRIAGGFRLGREYRIRRRVLLDWIARCEAQAESDTFPAATRVRATRARAAANQSDWRARIRATVQ